MAVGDLSQSGPAWFEEHEYVAPWQRLVIVVADITVVGFCYIALGVAILTIAPMAYQEFVITSGVMIWFYHVVLKRSQFRTVGYRLAGARIVDLKGEKPSILRMTYRLLLRAFGPFPMLFELLFTYVNDDRQTLCDRYSGTLVIRNNAEAHREATYQIAHCHAWGLNLTYRRTHAPDAY